MTRAEDLLQALNGLQRAADSELSGDAREAASQYVKELFRFAGFDGEDAGEGEGEAKRPFRLRRRLPRCECRPRANFRAMRSIWRQ